MAVSGAIFKPIVSTGATNLVVSSVNTVLGLAQINLPESTRKMILRSRSNAELKISTSLGGEYITLKKKAVLSLDGLELTGKIIYIESDIQSSVVEVLITHG